MKSLAALVAFFTCFPVSPSRAVEIAIDSHKFTLPEGYTVEKIAGPPLIQRPIHIAFDESGVLYVTDSSGNTQGAAAQAKNPTHRILRLTDTDGDGVFDRSTVFADKLPFPEGALWFQGSLYVGAPPTIWKFTDTDGDGVADSQEPWFSKTVSGCGNDLHGPYAGPDGLIYWCKGEFAQQTLPLANGSTLVSRAAHVLRARPDGSQLEVVLTGGMNNPVGLAFSPSGTRFLSGTFLDLSGGGKRDGILHAVYGGVYGRVNDGVLQDHPRTGSLLPVLQQMGPAAPSGMRMSRSNALGNEGDLFCAEFNFHRVSRHVLSKEGASFRAEAAPLLVSDQTDFHPTDVIEDADGSLIVADTGGWYRICCPTSVSAKPEVLGGLYRIRKINAPRLVDPRGLKLNWAAPLPDWLSDPRPAVVERAVNALATPRHIPALLQSKARIPAIWCLSRISLPEAQAGIRFFLSDPDSAVRLAAIESIALSRDSAAGEALLAELSSHDLQLRSAAAMALGRIGDRRYIPGLLEAAANPSDRFLIHALAYALFEIGDPSALPPSEQSPIARTVREMFEVSKASASLPSISFHKEALSVEPDPSLLSKQSKRLDELAALLPTGDASRGAVVFQNASQSLCMNCHTFGSQGVAFGPDLTKIGAIRTPRELLESIVYPANVIARYYEPLIVRTKQGESMGLIRKDGSHEIIVAAAPGAEVQIPRSEILETQFSKVSLMPPIFDGLLSPQQIADLVTYLLTAK
jgi:putative membrane-bound dehydrogenase-like protein